jgi:hypothetical protein
MGKQSNGSDRMKRGLGFWGSEVSGFKGSGKVLAV